jgi:hypothetical protein
MMKTMHDYCARLLFVKNVQTMLMYLRVHSAYLNIFALISLRSLHRAQLS